MHEPPDQRVRLRRNAAARRIVRAWRELTGGLGRDASLDRRTLVACSGGADSSALAIALHAGAPRPADTLVIAHIVHDLRPRAQALADRDAVRVLADRLGLPFVEGEAVARAQRQRNLEAAARLARYRALADLARASRCGFVATAHHADDQLESLLMAIVRGAGPRGLSGIARSRRLAGHAESLADLGHLAASPAHPAAEPPAPVLIRPCLDVTRDELEHLCHLAGHRWQIDATNADTSRLRASVRADIVPRLRALRPGVARRAAITAGLAGDLERDLSRRAAALLRRAAGAASSHADAASPPPQAEIRLDRAPLARASEAVLGEALRRAARRLTGDLHRDGHTLRVVAPLMWAIRDGSGRARSFRWRGVEIHLDAHRVVLRSVPAGAASARASRSRAARSRASAARGH